MNLPDILEPPEYLPQELWEDFVAFRKSHKTKKFTVLSQKMFFRKLERLRKEYDPILLVEQSIEKEWLSVHPNEECRYGKDKQHTQLSAAERVKAKAVKRANTFRLVGGDG
jgi:hypothetical protein